MCRGNGEWRSVTRIRIMSRGEGRRHFPIMVCAGNEHKHVYGWVLELGWEGRGRRRLVCSLHLHGFPFMWVASCTL